MPSLANKKLVDVAWQFLEGEELANALGTCFSTVRDENAWRTDKDEYHWGLYEGTGLGGVTVSSRKNVTYANATLPDNVCKMAVDTLTAKVATIRPIPQVLTSQGNWKDKRRAKKLRQLIQGEFYRQLVHEKLASKVIKDALVSRAGVVYVYADGKRPKVEHVKPWTLFVDDWDAEFGEPLTLMRLRTMDRRKAVAKLGTTKALKEKIREAGRLESVARMNRDEERSSTVDRVELLEAWYRCPDHDPDDKDHKCEGRHVIICEGALLFEEPWERPDFPFAILSYDTPNTGYWGTGIVQTLEGYQCSIDEANEKYNEALACSSKGVILRDGSGVFESDIVDGLRVIKCRPGPFEPKVFDFDLVNEHVRMRPPELVERGLAAVGLSQLAAQSKKPAGVDAGIALQTLDDIESQRHIVFGRRFESWCMDVARLIVETIKQIAKEHGDYAVKVPLKGAYLDLKWSDVHVDGFQLTMQSVGQLFTSFAGRLEKLKTLFDMQAIDRGTFMRELDAGDVQGELDLETVDRLRADEMIEAMLDAEPPANDNGGDIDRNYLAPDAYLPLRWAHRRAHQRRNMAQTEGAPLYVLGLLGRFIDDLDYLIKKEEGKDAAAMTPAGGPVQMDPNAPPPPPPGGGLPIDPMAAPAGDPTMMPMGMSPTGDQLMSGPDGAMPGMAA